MRADTDQGLFPEAVFGLMCHSSLTLLGTRSPGVGTLRHENGHGVCGNCRDTLTQGVRVTLATRGSRACGRGPHKNVYGETMALGPGAGIQGHSIGPFRNKTLTNFRGITCITEG